MPLFLIALSDDPIKPSMFPEFNAESGDLAYVMDTTSRFGTRNFVKNLGPSWESVIQKRVLKTVLSAAVNVTADDVDKFGSNFSHTVLINHSARDDADVVKDFIAFFALFIESGPDRANFYMTIRSEEQYRMLKRRKTSGDRTVGDEEGLLVDFRKAEESEHEEEENDHDEESEEEGQITEVKTDLWQASSYDDLVKLISLVDPAVKYEGFAPNRTRFAFITKAGTIEKAVRSLVICFAAYAHIGNNVSKLTKKRVDSDISRKLMNAVEAIGVTKRTADRDGFTLPRVAIAFMPQYLMYRKFLTEDLQSQTESTIDVVYKDICFMGCNLISSMTGYKEFHVEFSSYIYNPKVETKLDDPKFQSDYNRWNKVAKTGYLSDTAIHNHMNFAIQAQAMKRKNVVEKMGEMISEYDIVE